MFHEYDFSNICYKLILCFQSVLYRLYMKKCKPYFNYFLGSDITFASKSIRTTPTEHTEYNRNGNVMRTWRTNQRELVWENIGTVIANLTTIVTQSSYCISFTLQYQRTSKKGFIVFYCKGLLEISFIPELSQPCWHCNKMNEVHTFKI